MPRRRHHKKKNSTLEQSSAVVEDKENLPYIIKKNDTLGRYLVASRDLAEGAELISEPALVIGPAQDSSSVCLGCYLQLSDSSKEFRCNKCKWPLCSMKCTGLYKRHGHSKEECSTLVSCNKTSNQLAQHQLYNAIVPLRCLLMKEHHPDDWRTLLTMEAHNDIRKQIPTLWNYNQITVVDRIIKEWNISKFSEEEIHTVCGVLEVNAFAVGDESLNLRGIYPTAFLIAHSCVSNTSHTDDKEYNITVFASLPIPRDGTIFLSYTNSLQGTKKRREHLKQCKFFDCECSRCKDPTELGTYLSGIKCGVCSSGHLLPSDPLKFNAVWVCNNKKCDTTTPSLVVDTLTNRLENEIKNLNHNSIEELENSIRRHSKMVHKNHYLILGMQYTLSQLYGKAVGSLIHQMSKASLERKQQICEDILLIFDIIEPGMTNARGI